MPLLYVLNATRTLQNYGLVLEGATYDPIFSQGYINSKPNISIIGSSCFIDYSSTYSTSDLTYLIKMFESTPAGTTFALTDGNYYDSEQDYTVDVSGVFSLQSLTNSNKLVIGGIISGFTYTTNYKFYNQNNFIDPPQYTTGYTGGATASNYILNSITNNPAKSFINAGFLGSEFGKEEYVGLSGSTLNTGKLKINSVVSLKDNRELLYTDVVLTDENLVTNNITVTQYLRGNANPEILSKSRKALGCYVVLDADGNQVGCFENQNQLQAFLRSQYENSTYNSYWIPCLYCARLSDNATNAASADKSILFDGSVFFIINESPVPTFNDSGDLEVNYVYTLLANAEGSATLAATSSLDFNVDYGFKIDLSHPTLKGFSVNLYLDEEKTVPMTDQFYLIGTPGFDQSYLVYSKSTTSPKKIYMELNGNVIIPVEINVL